MRRVGRPPIYGLDVITANRVRRTRTALCLGKTRKQVARDIFRIPPSTFSRYMHKDDPRSKKLKRAVEEGEALRKEPLGELICYLLDMRENAQCELSLCECMQTRVLLSERIERYTDKMTRALEDNRELRSHRSRKARARTNADHLTMLNLHKGLKGGSDI